MATVTKQIIASQKNTVGNTPEIFYTSPADGLGTVITNFTATNDSSTTRSFKAYIVVSGGSATDPVVPTRTIIANRTDVSAELAGQMIPAGGTLQVESSLASSLVFTATGRELS